MLLSDNLHRRLVLGKLTSRSMLLRHVFGTGLPRSLPLHRTYTILVMSLAAPKDCSTPTLTVIIGSECYFVQSNLFELERTSDGARSHLIRLRVASAANFTFLASLCSL